MRCYLMALLVFVSGTAFALSLSPMTLDKLVYSNFTIHELQVVNNTERFTTYDVWVSENAPVPLQQAIDTQTEVIGADDYKMIRVRIDGIKPDELEVRFVCVQERPKENELALVVRMCAKLRLYYPLSELHKLQ